MNMLARCPQAALINPQYTQNKSQLASQEKEFKALQAIYTRLLEEHARTKAQHERWERDLQVKLETYKAETARLAANNTALQEQHDLQETRMVWGVRRRPWLDDFKLCTLDGSVQVSPVSSRLNHDQAHPAFTYFCGP